MSDDYSIGNVGGVMTPSPFQLTSLDEVQPGMQQQPQGLSKQMMMQLVQMILAMLGGDPQQQPGGEEPGGGGEGEHGGGGGGGGGGAHGAPGGKHKGHHKDHDKCHDKGHDKDDHKAGGPGGHHGDLGDAANKGKPFDAGPNEEIGQWGKDVQNAADISGVDPNLIGGMMWAESRGNPKESSTNDDGHEDKGLMQISQERWDEEIAPHLTQEERASIKEKTGKEPEELDMSDPHDNVIGGALEFKQKLEEKGNVEDALKYYQGGSDIYVKNVMQYWDELASGKKLSEDPFGSP
jgi:hypothetical protein